MEWTIRMSKWPIKHNFVVRDSLYFIYHNHNNILIPKSGDIEQCPLCREEPPDEIKVQLMLLDTSSPAFGLYGHIYFYDYNLDYIGFYYHSGTNKINIYISSEKKDCIDQIRALKKQYNLISDQIQVYSTSAERNHELIDL